jgi:hypothetical protein
VIGHLEGELAGLAAAIARRRGIRDPVRREGALEVVVVRLVVVVIVKLGPAGDRAERQGRFNALPLGGTTGTAIPIGYPNTTKICP